MVMREFGLTEACSLIDHRGESVFGLSRKRVLERAAEAVEQVLMEEAHAG